MSHELAPFPPALFESDELMREANKPQVTELLKKFWSPTATHEAPKFTGVVPVDGGSLLKTINWVKNTKLQQVVQLCINYVTNTSSYLDAQ